jgi:hypothetical protein
VSESLYNIKMWSDDWSPSHFMEMIERLRGCHIRVLGAEEMELMGFDQKKDIKRISRALKRSSNKCTFVSGGWPDSKINWPAYSTVEYWPTFWMSHTVKSCNDANFTVNHTDFEYLFITLNHRPWEHRCRMMDNLAKDGILGMGAYSWNKIEPDYNFKHWKQQTSILDNFNDKLDHFNNMPKEYSQSFIELVNESSVDNIFITEKTAKPLFYKKPFIIHGARGIHKVLQRLGFKLYDELFDYTFDNEWYNKTRASKIVKEIRNNVTTPKKYLEMYKSLEYKLEFNHQRLLEISKDENYIPDTIKELGGYENVIS